MATKKPAPKPSVDSASTGGTAGTYSASTTGTADTSQVPTLPPALAQWIVPGSTASLPTSNVATRMSRTDIIQTLARFFRLNGTGKDLETQVIHALGQRYGVGLGAGQASQVTNAAEATIQRQEGNVPGLGKPTGVFAQEKPLPGETAEPGSEAATAAEVAGGPRAEPAGKAMAAKAEDQILVEVAQAAGLQVKGGAQDLLNDPKAAAALMEDLGINPNTGAVGGAVPSGKTAAELYANMVKELDSKGNVPGTTETYKQAWTTYLANGNLLSLTANQGTPDNATIAGAYLTLLQQAQQNNQTITAAYSASQKSANVPGGGPPTQATSEKVANIEGMATKLGVYLSPDDVTAISNMPDIAGATDVSLVQDEIKNAVVQYFNPNDPRNPPGAASDLYQQVVQAAQNYGIPLSSANVMGWVQNGIKNSAGDSYSIAQIATDTSAAATKLFQQQAAGLYPSLAPQIMAGQNVSTLIAPYNNITAEYTGIAPATLADPGSAPGGPTGQNYAFLQGSKDPQSGNPAMMTMDQWRQELMSNPSYGFQNTQGGKDLAEQFTAALLNAFGKVNTMGGTSTPFSNYGGQQFLASGSNPNTGG